MLAIIHHTAVNRCVGTVGTYCAHVLYIMLMATEQLLNHSSLFPNFFWRHCTIPTSLAFSRKWFRSLTVYSERHSWSCACLKCQPVYCTNKLGILSFAVCLPTHSGAQWLKLLQVVASYPFPISILTFAREGNSGSRNGNKDWVRGYAGGTS